MEFQMKRSRSKTSTAIWRHLRPVSTIPFRCRSSVAVSPFCRCKIPLFCKNYVRKFRFVPAVNRKKGRQRQRHRQRCTETATAKWQRKNGNAMMETAHYLRPSDRAPAARALTACRPVTRGVGAGGWPPVCRQKVRFCRWKKVFQHAIKLKFLFVSLSLYCQMKSQTQ